MGNLFLENWYMYGVHFKFPAAHPYLDTKTKLEYCQDINLEQNLVFDKNQGLCFVYNPYFAPLIKF